MIRHSSSLIFSLIFHILLAVAIFLGYKAILLVDNTDAKEKLVKINLCCIPEIKPTIPTKKEIKQVLRKAKLQTEPILKPIKKIKPITKPKPKPKPKKVVSIKDKPKIEPIKQIERIEQKIEKEEIIEKEKVEHLEKEETIQKQNKQADEKKVLVSKESTQEKELRLEQNYMDQNILKIKELLQNNLYYPRSARKRGVTGDVIVKFKLSTSAQVHYVKVLSSSSEILSRAAIKTIEDLSGKFPHPNEELILHVPINYRLNQ